MGCRADAGRHVIVEANTTPGLDIHQCHGSLKQTAEQRGFWAEIGM